MRELFVCNSLPGAIFAFFFVLNFFVVVDPVQLSAQASNRTFVAGNLPMEFHPFSCLFHNFRGLSSNNEWQNCREPTTLEAHRERW